MSPSSGSSRPSAETLSAEGGLAETAGSRRWELAESMHPTHSSDALAATLMAATSDLGDTLACRSSTSDSGLFDGTSKWRGKARSGLRFAEMAPLQAFVWVDSAALSHGFRG
jgi:hypothetical protein